MKDKPLAPITSNQELWDWDVRQIYLQLTQGCLSKSCQKSFCANNNRNKRWTHYAATALAFELAYRLRESPQLRKDIVCGLRYWTNEELNQVNWLLSPSKRPNSSIPSRLRSLFSFFRKKRFDLDGDRLQVKDATNDYVVQITPLSGFKELISDLNQQKLHFGNFFVPLNSYLQTIMEDVFQVNRYDLNQLRGLMRPKKCLDMKTLNHLMEIYWISKHSDTILNLLKCVFSSKNFLLHTFTKDSSRSVSIARPLELDWDKIKSPYEILTSVHADSLLKRKEKETRLQITIIKALEVLVADLRDSRSQWDEHNVYLWMIACTNPWLHASSYRCVLREWYALTAVFTSEMENQLIRALVSLDDAYLFNFMVRQLSTFCAEEYRGSRRANDDFIGCVHLLAYMYQANEMKQEALIPFTTFYNVSLVNHLLYKEEYQYWKNQGLQTNGSGINDAMSLSTDRAGFSILKFPFLLDAFAKSALIRIDAMTQMSQKFENAVIESACVLYREQSDSNRPLESSSVLMNRDTTGYGPRMSSLSIACPYLLLEIRRDQLVQDTFAQLSTKERDLKKPLKIRFVNEEGLDQGGVQKEFFQSVFDQLLDPEEGLFLYDKEETRYSWFPEFLSLTSFEERYYEVVGMLLGLALYNGVIVNVCFPMTLYRKLLHRPLTISDLANVSPGLAQGLYQLLNHEAGDTIEDLFGLKFVANREQREGLCGKAQIITVSLKSNGDNIPVTDENRGEYISLYIDLVLNRAIKRPFDAFSRGFYKLCDCSALSLCRPEELEALLIGREADLDFETLETVTDYEGGYYHQHPVIEAFWRVVHEFSPEQKKKFLRFVTASDRMPLKGMSSLRFIIQRNGPDSNRLPTSLTCFGRLLLPEYASEEALKNRLTLAIENAKGFGLV